MIDRITYRITFKVSSDFAPNFTRRIPDTYSLKAPTFFRGDTNKGPFTNDVRREGEGGGCPNSDAVREVA